MLRRQDAAVGLAISFFVNRQGDLFLKKLLLGLLSLPALAASGAVCAQSSVTLYGIIDEAVRFDTHQNKSGGKLFTMGSGGEIQGSRWGLQGTEDLGAGLAAIFQLEGGFTPNTGVTQQSTPSGAARLFGRTALVGLSSPYGTVTLGRQYTLVHETGWTHDIYAFANYTGTVGFQGAGLTGGGRLDNTVRYTSPTLAGFTLKGAYTFGQTAGNFHQNSSPAVSISYDNGPLNVGAAYQIVNNIGGLNPATTAYGSTYFGVTIPDSSQKIFTAGATYKFGAAKLFGSYIYSHVYPADYRNDSFSAAVQYYITPTFVLDLPVYVDFVHHAGQSGTRITSGPTFDYLLSKRTDVYVGVDYNHLTGAWTTLAAASGSNQPFFGFNSLFEAAIGLRHRF
ncbi:putative porin [Trinickia symbiotica]|uniref:Porin n=1 Tax=Trinickia symbiotica TaxID=863227 RepID=A0A2N7WVA2_9BURK|nr:porin [Trinickia symbiotica]PPK42282.1 putative porin [Trinickia symbiotica]